jgi:hypothetical protein
MRHWSLFLMLATAACRGATPAAAPVPAGPVMPDSIGSLRKIGQRVLIPTDTLWRYEDGRAQVSVIRYPIREASKVGTDTSQWLLREGESLIRAMPLLQQRRQIDSYSVRLSRVEAGPNPPALEYAGVVLEAARGKRTIESQYLYIVGGRWLKVRATEPDDSSASSPVPAFARTMANRLAGMNR